jgi:hypothetical protein
MRHTNTTSPMLRLIPKRLVILGTSCLCPLILYICRCRTLRRLLCLYKFSLRTSGLQGVVFPGCTDFHLFCFARRCWYSSRRHGFQRHLLNGHVWNGLISVEMSLWGFFLPHLLCTSFVESLGFWVLCMWHGVVLVFMGWSELDSRWWDCLTVV